MTEALNTPNDQMRSNMVRIVVQQVARSDPANAVAILDQIEDRQQKIEASQHLMSSWIHQDPEAAIAWILGQDKETAGRMIQMAAFGLVDNDIDAAIRLLPRIERRCCRWVAAAILRFAAFSRSER